MPNANAVVSGIVRFEPSLDRPPAELLRTGRGLTVELEGERHVRLDSADPRSAGFAQVLEGLRNQRLPVYLEIDPTTSTITRLLIPRVGRIADVRSTEQGALDIELQPSHARHVLRLGEPDSANLERELREAHASGTPVIVTEDDGHYIIDVRAFTPGPNVALPPFPEPQLPPPEVPSRPAWLLKWIIRPLRRLWWWLCWLWWWLRCPSTARAQQIFDAMAAASCDPLTVPAPCIPFLYPDDGCWARAHEMCRLMIKMGLSPRKVWISASTVLHVNTRNNPACFVDWGWHVAPTLLVRGPSFFQVQSRVIDPSLFTTPVAETTWKSVQGDANATLTETDASQFWQWGGSDPSYSDTNYYLAYYRIDLQYRSINHGPPPYANCP